MTAVSTSGLSRFALSCTASAGVVAKTTYKALGHRRLALKQAQETVLGLAVQELGMISLARASRRTLLVSSRLTAVSTSMSIVPARRQPSSSPSSRTLESGILDAQRADRVRDVEPGVEVVEQRGRRRSSHVPRRAREPGR
jgi:hypothetical protein